MFTFNEAQIMAWLTPVFWPFLRALALFTAAPVLSSRAVPMRVKIGLAFFIALAAQPSLSGQPLVPLNTAQALGTVVHEVGVGLALGFAVRLVFAAVELAGEVIGLQMGLNFATFFDPASNAQANAVTRFFGAMTVLMFVAAGGHLVLIMALIKSFDLFPVGGVVGSGPTGVSQQLALHRLGAELFSTALWIALPLIALMMLVNLALGVISRVAPQINIYAVGFPITLTAGLVAIALTLPLLDQPFLRLLERTIELFHGR